MAQPLAPDTPAPDFALLDGEGRRIRLSGFRGRNVMLAFYPGDWTPVCTSELSLFEETLDDIRGYNAEVLGLSCDTRHSHRAWAERMHLTIPLLSDFWPHGDVARQYGVFRDVDGTCERALVFIDSVGTVKDVWVAPDPDVAPGLNLVFDALGRIHAQYEGEASHV
jgi:peroxiredoxin